LFVALRATTIGGREHRCHDERCALHDRPTRTRRNGTRTSSIRRRRRPPVTANKCVHTTSLLQRMYAPQPRASKTLLPLRVSNCQSELSGDTLESVTPGVISSIVDFDFRFLIFDLICRRYFVALFGVSLSSGSSRGGTCCR
jgi:hypothetical protein